MIDTKGKYNIALEDKGFILEGQPERPAYVVSQAPIYSNRFSQGDRTYNDFSFWWFWAQTDWSGGYKEDIIWADDAKFYSSEAVNTHEKPGSILLNWRMLGLATIAKDLEFHSYFDNLLGMMLVGDNQTDNSTFSYTVGDSGIQNGSETGEFTDGYTFDGDEAYWGVFGGSGTSNLRYGFSPWGTPGTAGSHEYVGTLSHNVQKVVGHQGLQKLYLFTINGGTASGVWELDISTGALTQKKTAAPRHAANNNLSFFWNKDVKGKGIWLIGDRIYFTMPEGLSVPFWRTHLWCYDISEDAYVHIHTWEGGFGSNTAAVRDTDLYLVSTNYATDRVEVWKYATSSGAIEHLHTIGRAGETTRLKGNVVADSTYVYFIVDDGTSNYQIWQLDKQDRLFSGIKPPAQFSNNVGLFAIGANGRLAITTKPFTNPSYVGYYDTMPQNDRQLSGWVKTSIHDADIPTIDKLYHSITFSFDPLISGHSIQILYSFDGGQTFSSLGTASYATDGAIKSKTLSFPDASVSKSCMLKIVLNGNGGDDTPSFNDFSVKFVPMTNYAKSWTLRLNCSDNLYDLSGQPVTATGRELAAFLENAWLTKSVLDYQDINYASTLINGSITAGATTIVVDSTRDFPEQGRLKIGNEEIFYTGKTEKSFTGCTRGTQGSVPSAHSDNAVISTGLHRVIISDFEQRIPILQKDRKIESVVTLSLREAGVS